MSTTMNNLKAFKCQVPNCSASYRRKEHLQRHVKTHDQHIKFSCSTCHRDFKRRDTLQRHLVSCHELIEPRYRAKKACYHCHAQKSRCKGGVPCDACVSRNIKCNLSESASAGDDSSSEPLTSISPIPAPDRSQLCLSDKRHRYLSLYFERFHPRWSIIHKESFKPDTEEPLLVQTMIAIGMWMREERSAQLAAIQIHRKLKGAICTQMGKWGTSDLAEPCTSVPWPIPTYQAILLQIILSLMMDESPSIGVDLSVRVRLTDFEILKTLVKACRDRGICYYPNIIARYKDVGLDPLAWVCVEEVKRFSLALYRVCRRVSSSGTWHGSDRLLMPGDLQFPLPTNNRLWNATGKDGCLAALAREKLPSWDYDYREKWISNHAEFIELLEPY